LKQRSRLVQKLRLDALTDGVFSVAMTLLVIDMKLPENFQPTSAAQLVAGLLGLHTQFFVYVISFLVLGLRWMSLAKLSGLHEKATDSYVQWALLHLFLITCIPFSTMVVGRYGDLAPAVWLYVSNTLLAALVALRMAKLVEPEVGAEDARERRIGLVSVIVVSLLVLAGSFVWPKRAMWIYLLNLAVPALRYWLPAGKRPD
jgi:uncharacterized membrane protein